MTRDNAKDYIKNQLKSYLEGIGIDTNKNFKCKAGTHEDKSPSMSYKENRVKCFSCGFSGDIFDLIGLEYGLTENKDKFSKAYELFEIDIDAEPYNKGIKPIEPLKGADTPPPKENALNSLLEPQITTNYTEYFIESKKTLKNNEMALQYLINRGLSLEIIDKFGLGYDGAWKHPGSETMHPTQRIIIPATMGSYTARDISPTADKAYKAMKTGPSSLYNIKALYQDKPVFIAEGEFDALSVAECGAVAVGLGSTNNVKKLIEELKSKPPKAEYLIISLDNDQPGERASSELIEYLKTTDILYLKANISGVSNDINEALQTNRTALETNIGELLKGYEAANKYILTQNIKGESAAAHLPAFIDRISTNKKVKPIPTGFAELDFILDGGLFGDTLYFIGSISSLGKTTLALQIADNVAQQGETALIFSLEMARTELMAKSISRTSFLSSGGDTLSSATAREVMTGNYETIKTKNNLIYLSETEQSEKRANISQSITDYSLYAEKVVIHEGIGVTNIQTIKDTVKRFIRAGIKPVVFIDYMQIIAPSNDRKTDKQTLDETVMLLKQMAREYKIAIIGVSSFNRESYTSPVSMASFKESGAIEYSSDVLIGLQLEGIEDYSKLSEAQKKNSGFDVNELKSQYPRKIELKVLKNRNGPTGNILNYELYSKYNYFKEVKPYGVFVESEQPPRATKGKGKVYTPEEMQAAELMEVRQKR
jgi:replicative DNA helicase